MTPQGKFLAAEQIAANGVVQVPLQDPPAANQFNHRNFHRLQKEQDKPSFLYHQSIVSHMDF